MEQVRPSFSIAGYTEMRLVGYLTLGQKFCISNLTEGRECVADIFLNECTREFRLLGTRKLAVTSVVGAQTLRRHKFTDTMWLLLGIVFYRTTIQQPMQLRDHLL